MGTIDDYSGIISLFVACIEIVLLINILIFGEKNRVNKHLFILIILLFGYQLFEFFICYFEFDSPVMIYLAFVDISLLPPIGLIAVLLLSGYKNNINYLLLIPPVFFSIYYLFVLDQFSVSVCTILFAGYNYPLSELYGAFYYLPILTSLYLLYQKFILSGDPDLKRRIGILSTGYVLFFIPPWIIITIDPSMMKVVESFLCKFAVFLAVGASFFVLMNRSKIE